MSKGKFYGPADLMSTRKWGPERQEACYDIATQTLDILSIKDQEMDA